MFPKVLCSSVKLCIVVRKRQKLAYFPTFLSVYFCSLIQTKSFRQPTRYRTALHISYVPFITHKWPEQHYYRLISIILNEGTIRNTMFSELHFYSTKLLQLTYIQLQHAVIRLNSLGPYQQFLSLLRDLPIKNLHPAYYSRILRAKLNLSQIV